MKNPDATNRAMRERAELAVANGDKDLALEVCRMHVALYEAGWRYFELAPVIPSKPIEIVALYDGRCLQCRAPIAAGDRIVWSEGGTRCLRCGRREAA